MPKPVPRRSALRLLGTVAVAAALTGAGASACAARRGEHPGRSGAAARTDALLARLTLDEKVSLLHGAKDPEGLGQAGYVPGVPRLGIPPLRLADGPAGVRVAAPATALPAPVMLAAAFDPALARAYGRVIGREGRALRQDVLLSPMANLIRTPWAGRNFETFSEDPLLSADLVAAEIRGIQDEGLIATVKHFALNNQERDRETVDVHAAERTMHETELRAFEAAVAAGTGSVMGAYNKVGGTWACENKPLLTGILRERWGFDGFVTTDWYAAHSTADALDAGLDLEMPGGRHYGAALKKAVQDGTVPEDRVDRAVRRLLTVLDRFGLLDDRKPARPARNPAAGARVALDVAVAGATLLRNEHGTLPLTGARARSIAVIGPSGAVPFVSGGGSAHVVPDRARSPLDAVTERARRAARAGEEVRVRYAVGEDIHGRPLPADVVSGDADLEGQEVGAGESRTYDGTLTVPEDAEWTLVVHYSGERPRVLLDGTDLFPRLPGAGEFFSGGFATYAADGLAVRRRTLTLTSGAHRLRITAQGGDKGQVFRLRHITAATREADVAHAVRLAKEARSVLLFAYEDASEGHDRTTLALPGHQERLIEAVTAANPRTVVVLNTSSAVTMPWLERTGAVLQMYYPGQEGAAATAAVLFGDTDPGGRLTQTFPAAEDRHPTAGDPLRYPGRDGREEYSEGVHVGYRWYARQRQKPLFPFGHGLSYTTFEYSGLEVAAAEDGGLKLSFSMLNNGPRAGIAVPQVYLGPSPDLGLDQPERILAGYRRLELGAGERRTVGMRISPRTLSSWDDSRHDWVLGTGTRRLEVAESATAVRLGTTARVPVRPR
ncbi:beta-glucosidase [Streptomyces sp. GC420]|uniref:beta-glucosidase family protein n=1 Tax=Streptomyces sp. GC420 TaxID=2697568 RepID=UPI001414D127|nr:glycoside hydrolase family 3 C-terminal domain-containing protein [Streptomyces sp. GC420]NBM18587.1 beta-glucosidase [Streptomyces sp. GC420]